MSNTENHKVLMLTTPSCGGCKVLKPIIESKGLDIEIVDATEDPDTAAEHNVTSVPAFVVEDENGKHVKTLATGAGEGMKFVQEFSRFI